MTVNTDKIFSRRQFTLIELLIVIALLGGLAMIVLPSLRMRRSEAVEGSLAPAEMMDIRRAFAAFAADCAPTAADLEKIARYGLDILVEFNDERGWSFPEEFDPARGRGWRGPYIEAQGSRTVYIEEVGQPLAGSGDTATIPVVLDPYHDSRAETPTPHYYRVIRLENNDDSLKLIFVGADGELGTDDDIVRTLVIP